MHPEIFFSMSVKKLIKLVAAASSHEGGFTNTSAVLESQGKLTGVSIDSFTILYEVRDD